MYVPRNESRGREFWFSLERNAQNPCIEAIHVFPPNEKAKIAYSARVSDPENKIIYHNHLYNNFEQLTYGDEVELATKVAPGKLKVLVCADTVLGNWSALAEGMLPREAFFLSRHEDICLEDHQTSHPGHCNGWGSSQDTLVWEDDDLSTAVLEFPRTRSGVENTVVSGILDAGFTVTNPCMALTTYHVHCSNIRTGSRRRKNGRIGGSGFLLTPSHKQMKELSPLLLRETRCVSFSAYGFDPTKVDFRNRYYGGLLDNLMMHQEQFPNWIVRIYHSIPGLRDVVVRDLATLNYSLPCASDVPVFSSHMSTLRAMAAMAAFWTLEHFGGS